MRRSYVFWHWIITLLLSPILFIALLKFLEHMQDVDVLGMYFASFIYSAVFSVPTLMIYILCFYYLSKNNINLTVSKIVLVAISVVGAIITISIMGGSLMKDLAIAYSFTTLIVGISLKLS